MEKPSVGKMKEDIQGEALWQYYKGGRKTLQLHNSYGPWEEMPIEVFFRDYDDFPDLEQFALTQVTGKVLDVGAGAGAHSLYLQQQGYKVTAIEQSEKTVQLLRERGVMSVVHGDVFRYRAARYDTLLLLMNGIGLVGKLAFLPEALTHFAHLLKPGGQVIFDSSDISYLYDEVDIPKEKYRGELSYCYEYKGQMGEWFDWLYLDQEKLMEYVDDEQWSIQVIYEEGDGHYLVRMTLEK